MSAHLFGTHKRGVDAYFKRLRSSLSSMTLGIDEAMREEEGFLERGFGG